MYMTERKRFNAENMGHDFINADEYLLEVKNGLYILELDEPWYVWTGYSIFVTL